LELESLETAVVGCGKRSRTAPIKASNDAVPFVHRILHGLQALRLRGVEVLDIEPPDLPVALVNRYLDIKHSGRL